MTSKARWRRILTATVVTGLIGCVAPAQAAAQDKPAADVQGAAAPATHLPPPAPVLSERSRRHALRTLKTSFDNADTDHDGFMTREERGTTRPCVASRT